MSIHKKIFSIMREVRPIQKTAQNPFFESRYANLESIQSHVTNLCLTHEVLWLNAIEEKDGKTYLVTKLIDLEDDTSIESAFLLPSVSDVQKIGSAITYARRYNISALLNLVATDDDDGQSFNQEVINQQKIQQEQERDQRCITDEEFKTLVGLIEHKGYDPLFIWKEEGMTVLEAKAMSEVTRKVIIKKLGAK